MDTTVIVIVLAVVAAVAFGVFVWLRGRPPKEEPFYHFRCTHCRRRLRYQERQVGHKGKCSNCGKDVLFPHSSQSID